MWLNRNIDTPQQLDCPVRGLRPACIASVHASTNMAEKEKNDNALASQEV